jgi:DNA-binding NarL/FixJ family response regulator
MRRLGIVENALTKDGLDQESAATADKDWPEDVGGQIWTVVVAPALAVRAGLRAWLGALDRVQVTGEAASLAELALLPPGSDVLVLADEGNAASSLSQAMQVEPEAAVLLLVGGEIQAAQALAELPARAWGILPLEASAEELAAAVYALAEGLYVGAPGLARQLFSRAGERPVETEPLVEPLTEREGEVLQLLAQGLANKQIAGALGISEHTVKFHTSAIYAKLGAASRTEAVRLGVQKGLIIL